MRQGAFHANFLTAPKLNLTTCRRAFNSKQLSSRRPIAQSRIMMNFGDGFSDDQARKSALDKMVEGINNRFGDVQHITPAELLAMQKERNRVIIVDVRMQDEYDISHLPGAVSAEQFESCKAELTSKEAAVVAYCTVGYRSSTFAQKLSKEGWEVFNLSGSILAWTHEGLPLVTGQEGAEVPTKAVHVFGERWRLQPSTYEPVMFRTPFLSLAMNKISGTISNLFSR